MRVAVRNAADGNQVRSAEQRGRRRERTDSQELLDLLQLPAFRRYVWRQLNRAPIFEGGMAAPDVLAYEQGKRSIGVAMLREVMEADLAAFPLMQREAQEQEVTDERRDDNDD